MTDRARYDGRYPEPPYPEMPPDLSGELAKAEEEIVRLRSDLIRVSELVSAWPIRWAHDDCACSLCNELTRIAERYRT